eukprot:GEMP01003616.1.p1 GENE.GEMP01003616.1~~GEMP01003616.1.p1  ORF type:complete len:1101 (-),score=236.91 GEMP01003616.1:1083-4385(-)
MSARVVVNLKTPGVFWDKGPHEAQWVLCRTLASLIQAVAMHSIRTRTTEVGSAASSSIRLPALSRSLASLMDTLGRKLDINVEFVDERVNSAIALPKAEEPTHDLQNLAERIVSFTAESDTLSPSSFDGPIADRRTYGMEGSFIDEIIVWLRTYAVNQYTLMTMRTLARVDEEISSMRASVPGSMQNAVVKDPIVLLSGDDFPSDAPIDATLTAVDLADLAEHGGTVCVFGCNTWPYAKALLRKICVCLNPVNTIGCLTVDENNAMIDALGDRGQVLQVVRHQHSGFTFPTMSCAVADNEDNISLLIDYLPLSPTCAMVAFVKRAGDCAQGSARRISVVALPPTWSPDDVMPQNLASILREAPVAIFVCPDEVIADVYRRMALRIKERWCCAPRNTEQAEIEESFEVQNQRAQNRIPLKVMLARLQLLREAEEAQKKNGSKQPFHFWVRPPMVPSLCSSNRVMATPIFPSFTLSPRALPSCVRSSGRASVPNAGGPGASPLAIAPEPLMAIPFFSGAMPPLTMAPPPGPLPMPPVPSMSIPFFSPAQCPPATMVPVPKGVFWASNTSTPTLAPSSSRGIPTRERDPPQQQHGVPLAIVDSEDECSPIFRMGSLPMSPLVLQSASKGSPVYISSEGLAASPARRRTPQGDAARRHTFSPFRIPPTAGDGAWSGDGINGETVVPCAKIEGASDPAFIKWSAQKTDGMGSRATYESRKKDDAAASALGSLSAVLRFPKTREEQSPQSRGSRPSSVPASSTRGKRTVGEPRAALAHATRHQTIPPARMDAVRKNQAAATNRPVEDETTQVARKSTRRSSDVAQGTTATPRRKIASKILKTASDILDSNVEEPKTPMTCDADDGEGAVPRYMRSTTCQQSRATEPSAYPVTKKKMNDAAISKTRGDLPDGASSEKQSVLSSASSATIPRKPLLSRTAQMAALNSKPTSGAQKRYGEAAQMVALDSKPASGAQKRYGEAAQMAALGSKPTSAGIHKRYRDVVTSATRGKAALHGSGRMAGREDSTRNAARHNNAPQSTNSTATSRDVLCTKAHPTTARAVGSTPPTQSEAATRTQNTATCIREKVQKSVTGVPSRSISLITSPRVV